MLCRDSLALTVPCALWSCGQRLLRSEGHGRGMWWRWGPGGQTTTWESPRATGRSSYARAKEEVLYASCSPGPPEFILPQPISCTWFFLPDVLLYHKGKCLVQAGSLSQLLRGLLSFCWCVVDSRLWRMKVHALSHCSEIASRLFFLFLLTSSVSF